MPAPRPLRVPQAEPHAPSYFIVRVLFLAVLGAVLLLLGWFLAVSALAPELGRVGGRAIERADVFKAVATDIVRVSLSPLWPDAPWPDGLIIARLQAKFGEVDALLLHLSVSAAAFALLGFMAGRMGLTTSVLVLPLALSFLTYGLLHASFVPVPPLNLLNLVLMGAAQCAAVYAGALWGKWSLRQ